MIKTQKLLLLMVINKLLFLVTVFLTKCKQCFYKGELTSENVFDI